MLSGAPILLKVVVCTYQIVVHRVYISELKSLALSSGIRLFSWLKVSHCSTLEVDRFSPRRLRMFEIQSSCQTPTFYSI